MMISLIEPVEKSLLHHFDPSELRGKDGKWISSGELADHAEKAIPDRDGPATPQNGYRKADRDKAFEAARNGEPHKAARILRESALAEAAKPDWQQNAEYTAKAKEYADAFSKLPDDSPDEVERENKFLIHHAAHPKLMDDEAEKQAEALDKLSSRAKKQGYTDVAGHLDNAVSSLREMDFDTAAKHLNDAQRSRNLDSRQLYDLIPDASAISNIRSHITAAQTRTQKAADYSWDMKMYGLYQPTVAMIKSLSARRPVSQVTTAGVFSDLVTEKARIDEERGWRLAAEVAKFGPHGYEHGWIKETPGMTPADVADVQAHHADEKDTAMRSEMAAPGSPGHAAELRQLGNEADLHEARNYASLATSKPGMTSDRAVAREGADRAQKGDPAYADRLNAAADKLDLLPEHQGLAGLPENETAEEAARTAAARRYAKKVRKLEKELQRVRSGIVAVKWYNSTMNEEAGTPEVAKVGPEGYVHGWIKVGLNGEHSVKPGDEVVRTDTKGNPHHDGRTYQMTDKPGRLNGTHTLSFTPANSLGHSELNDVPARQIIPANLPAKVSARQVIPAIVDPKSKFNEARGVASKPKKLAAASDEELKNHAYVLSGVARSRVIGEPARVSARRHLKLINAEIERRQPHG
jgi:hypothetical protein